MVFMFLFLISIKLMYMKIKQYKYVFRSLLNLERKKYRSTFPMNIESSLIPPLDKYLFACKQIYIDTMLLLHSEGNIFKIMCLF